MNEELLLNAAKLFDTVEKWNAFNELVNVSSSIRDRWWRRLQAEVYDREIRNPHPDWDIDIWNNWDIRWSIKGYANNTLVIHFWGDCFRVFYGYSGLNKDKVNEQLKNPKFDAIKNCFDRIDGIDSSTIAWECRNFSFDSIYDRAFPDHMSLSWYAGHRTNDFADQLIAKVRKFQTLEITALFREINETCKI